MALAIDDDEVVEEDGVVIVQLLSNAGVYTVNADEAMQYGQVSVQDDDTLATTPTIKSCKQSALPSDATDCDLLCCC